MPANGGGEEGVGLARVEHVRVAPEDVADDLRVGEHDEPAVAGDVERESVAVAAVALVEEAEGVASEADQSQILNPAPDQAKRILGSSQA